MRIDKNKKCTCTSDFAMAKKNLKKNKSIKEIN